MITAFKPNPAIVHWSVSDNPFVWLTDLYSEMFYLNESEKKIVWTLNTVTLSKNVMN